MKNTKAYAHATFNRRQLLSFIRKGGLRVEIEVDYQQKTLKWEWKDKPSPNYEKVEDLEKQ